MSEPLKLLVATEVAEVMRSSVRHVREKTATGELPHLRFGRKVLYPAAALERYLEEQQQRTAAAVQTTAAPLPTVSGRRIRPARAQRALPQAPVPAPVDPPRSPSGRVRPLRPSGGDAA